MSASAARTSGIGTASYSAPEQLGAAGSGGHGGGNGGDGGGGAARGAEGAGGGGGGGGGGGLTFYSSAVDIFPLGLILMELFCVHETGEISGELRVVLMLRCVGRSSLDRCHLPIWHDCRHGARDGDA